MTRKLHLKKDRSLTFFFTFLAILLFSLLSCLIFLKYIEQLERKSAENRFRSLNIADELRQSSDDLTKMVRLYVITGDEKYRDFYYEIIGIREGKLPHPRNYHQVYWDLVTDTKHRPRSKEDPIEFKQLMLNEGFSIKEFDLLKEAENRSKDLAVLEEEAMNAMVGKFSEGASHVQGEPNPGLAKKLVFGPQYMIAKVAIMQPIQAFYESVEARTDSQMQYYQRLQYIGIVVAIFLAIVSTIVMLISIFKALRSLSKMSEDNETLLLNVLPSAIADRLKQGEGTIADEYPQASVIFADIVGFTSRAKEYGPEKTVEMLSLLFDEFDNLSEKFGIEKVKTIGDNYMAVAGVPIPASDHAIRLADFALALIETIKQFNKANKTDIKVRIGMTYGSVIAGVIGHKKFLYDIWGDVVNTASRMESTGEENKIQVTEKMAMMLAEKFNLEERGEIEVKGIGRIKTFFLTGKKQA